MANELKIHVGGYIEVTLAEEDVTVKVRKCSNEGNCQNASIIVDPYANFPGQDSKFCQECGEPIKETTFTMKKETNLFSKMVDMDEHEEDMCVVNNNILIPNIFYDAEVDMTFDRSDDSGDYPITETNILNTIAEVTKKFDPTIKYLEKLQEEKSIISFRPRFGIVTHWR